MLDPFELLKALHALAAVDEGRAVEVEKVASIVGAPSGEIEEALSVLRRMEYVCISGKKVYLTEIGIMKISSLFC
jgi:DNA-binding IclR family transcriptional regulator